jgi:hypothetical protein
MVPVCQTVQCSGIYATAKKLKNKKIKPFCNPVFTDSALHALPSGSCSAHMWVFKAYKLVKPICPFLKIVPLIWLNATFILV